MTSHVSKQWHNQTHCDCFLVTGADITEILLNFFLIYLKFVESLQEHLILLVNNVVLT